MKRLAVVFSALLFAPFVNGQAATWNISFNGKLLLTASEENEMKNVIRLPKSDIDKNSQLLVEYVETAANKEWTRKIMIVNEKDSLLFEKPNTAALKLSYADLKKIIAGAGKLKIYTIATPKDPAKAAAIRIRRVHLCTLELE